MALNGSLTMRTILEKVQTCSRRHSKLERNTSVLLLQLQRKDVLLGIEDPTAFPSQQFYTNTMSPNLDLRSEK